MAKRLTEEEIKQILADYVLTNSYTETAKMHGVSLNTVKRYVIDNAELVTKLQSKKSETNLSVEDYIVARQDKVKEIIDNYLELMCSDAILAKATPNQLTTAIGTLMDKFMNTSSKNDEQSESGGVIMMPTVLELEHPNE